MLGRSAVHDAFTAHVCQVREVVDGIYAACDTDDDGAIDRTEAKACRQHLYDLLASIPPPPSAAASTAAPASASATATEPVSAGAGKPKATATGGGAASGGATSFEELFSKLQGQGHGTGSAAQRGRSRPSDPLAMIPAPLRRKLQRIQRQALMSPRDTRREIRRRRSARPIRRDLGDMSWRRLAGVAQPGASQLQHVPCGARRECHRPAPGAVPRPAQFSEGVQGDGRTAAGVPRQAAQRGARRDASRRVRPFRIGTRAGIYARCCNIYIE